MLFKKAAQNGHVNVVETLINQGANVNSININGWSPLHFGYNLDTLILILY
jgi:ankyrin repeat protein